MRKANSHKRPHPGEPVSKDLTRMRQRSGKSISGKRMAGVQRPWGRNQPEVWGKSNEASMTAKWKNEDRKRSRDHITSSHTGLGSMAKTLELKCARKPQTWESFGYRGVAKFHLHI